MLRSLLNIALWTSNFMNRCMCNLPHLSLLIVILNFDVHKLLTCRAYTRDEMLKLQGHRTKLKDGLGHPCGTFWGLMDHTCMGFMVPEFAAWALN